MQIGITGASGFIGRALAARAAALGWNVRRLPRTPSAGDVAGLDAIVHLAGETVDGRWTARKKAEIERSRVEGTRALVNALREAEPRPRVLVSASAVGFYGDRGDEPLFETSAPGNDFLAGVCTKWEAQARRAEEIGMRVVMLRTGIVLGSGGALRKMSAPFKFGAGGPLGNGRQFVPWIHLDDIVEMYIRAVEDKTFHGPVNAVTPDYATSSRLAFAIGSAMRRPALAPAPGFALRVALGEFAETVLASQLVIPAAAQHAGFTWKYPRLETALQQILNPAAPSSVLHSFSAEQIVAAPLERVFAFFSDAKNLEAITPPSLRFGMLCDVGTLGAGTVIDYKLGLHGLPMRWKTLIATWEPPQEFVDVQLHGPYALWEHRHRFEEVAQGVRISDHVTYAMPLRPFGELAAGFVRNDVKTIFAYRSGVIAERFRSGN